MRIVIIDDDEDYLEILSLHLQSEGFSVFGSGEGLDGIQLVKQIDPDMVLLDVRLPYMDGWETCQKIRSFSEVPMIMISSVAKDEQDIIRALNLGADDYLTKPISSAILKAKVYALLRRSNNISWRQDRPTYIDEYLKVDLNRQEVSVNNTHISLSFLEFRLLEVLVRHANEVVTMLEIVEYLWTETDIDRYQSYVRIYISRLRHQIEPEPSDPIYIVNVHGLGYRFMPRI